MMTGVAGRVALFASLVAFVACDDDVSVKKEGLMLKLSRQISYLETDDTAVTFCCNFEGNANPIVSATLMKITTTGDLKTLSTVKNERPTETPSSLTVTDQPTADLGNLSACLLDAKGALHDNTGYIKLKLRDQDPCNNIITSLMVCEVTFKTSSGETMKAYTTTGPGKFSPPAPSRIPACESFMMDEAIETWDGYAVFNDTDIEKQILCHVDRMGGGWVVIQRRVQGDESFSRDWNTYREGFGSIRTDFWLGNEAIHQLTTKGNYELRIDFRLGQENNVYLLFSNFKVASEDDNYRLTLGNMTGTAGEQYTFGMSNHEGLPFSTFDRDNDIFDSTNCAVERKGGWWYKSCSKANFNGLWNEKSLRGMQYFADYKLVKQYVTYIEMKVRRIESDNSG